MTANGDREALIEAATTGEPNGLIPAARRALNGERVAVNKTLAKCEIPHLGVLAEADHLAYLCRLVEIKHMEHPERGWAAALDKTRGIAMHTLTGNGEAQADAWSRAYAESQRKAAARFIRDTEHLA